MQDWSMIKKVSDNPLISVIIPVFNSERYLAEAIESVFLQDYTPIEIIVVDDGSTDNSKNLVKSYGKRIKYLYQENGGPAKARNLALSVARGTFIACIDSDDVWAAGKLTKQLELFSKYENLGIALGLTVKASFSDKSELANVNTEELISFNLLLGSTLIKKSVFEIVGDLDNELIIGEDTDWFNRAKEMNIPIAVHRDVVQFHRNHEHNITNDKKMFNMAVFRILKKTKDRRLKQGLAVNMGVSKLYTLDDLIQFWHSAK